MVDHRVISIPKPPSGRSRTRVLAAALHQLHFGLRGASLGLPGDVHVPAIEVLGVRGAEREAEARAVASSFDLATKRGARHAVLALWREMIVFLC